MARTKRAKLKLGFIGAGTVGSALARRLSGKGYPVVSVYSRSPTSAHKLADTMSNTLVCGSAQCVVDLADIVFITTPDGAIPEVAASVTWRSGQSVVHCSGADPASVLDHASRAGANIGVFHPLQSFASIAQALANMPGSTFGVEAKEPLLSQLKQMASDLGGHAIVIKAEDRVLYHAAAVLASNYVVTLVKMAADLWGTFGASQSEAIRALVPLLRGTLNNVETLGLPNCLTGPIARGDNGTVSKHLDAMKEKTPGLLAAYRELGKQTIPIAVAKGRIDERRAREMERLLS